MPTQQYFESLKLTDWTFSGNIRGGGQAAIAEVRNVITDDIGIFRHLKHTTDVDVARFYRELNILLENPHTNIVPILDYTKDKQSQWYISKKCTPLETYWNHAIDRHIDDPNLLFEKAIKIILELNEGLIELHEKGVIHRDIKAKNAVIDNNQVGLLIDFGIAFIFDEERLTTEEDAMANVQSPDPALRFMKDVPAWLDVFLLSQLLIWMLGSRNKKANAQRPLDWRFVIYPNALSEDNLMIVRAITAICSDQLTSPKNAKELKTFIESIYMTKQINPEIPRDNIEEIKAILGKGKASEAILLKQGNAEITAALPAFLMVAQELLDVMKAQTETLIEQGIPIKIIEIGRVDIFNDIYYGNPKKEYISQPLIELYCKGVNRDFSVGIQLELFTSFYIKENQQYHGIINTPMIYARFMSAFLVLQNGRLMHYDMNLKPIGETTIEYIVKRATQILTDPHYWK
ncbi:MAG: protein kinase [Mucilaginibacter sp.]